jgi:fructokinase
MKNAWRIGIDLGGTKIEGVLLGDDPRTPLERVRISTPRGAGYEAIVEAIVGLAHTLLSRTPAGGEATIGIGIPGTISTTHGRVKNANTTELNGHALRDDLLSRLDRPVSCENDANCFVLAEALHGAGRGARCVFGVILGTGVGGGIVHDGRIWSGAQGIAGEWGHMVLDASGPPCYCSRRGCVETFLSGPAITRAYVVAGGEARPAAEIWASAVGLSPDPRARAVVATYKSRFGYALAQVINVLDPDVIVLGGGVSNSPGLAEEAGELIRPHLFNDEVLTVVRRHILGDSAGVLGAAWLGAEQPGVV